VEVLSAAHELGTKGTKMPQSLDAHIEEAVVLTWPIFQALLGQQLLFAWSGVVHGLEKVRTVCLLVDQKKGEICRHKKREQNYLK